MRNILFYLLVFFCHNLKGVTKDSIPVFEYEINYSLGKALVKKGYVFKSKNKIHFNTTKATFLEQIPKFIENNEEGMPEINIMAKGVLNENIIIDIKKDTLFSLDSAGEEPFVVSEKLFKQTWLPTGKKTKISERNCTEFTANFRGRFYTACVDMSVPFFFGPWKFNSLPGLVVSIKDSNNQLSWKLLSISYKSAKKIENFIYDQENYFKKYDKISLKNFVGLYDSSKGGTVPLGTSRMPRDFKKNKELIKWKRKGRELLYEWEKE